MRVNRQMVARKLMDYLYHRITLAELVDWAEWALMDADFDTHDLNLLREVVGELGLADVRVWYDLGRLRELLVAARLSS